MFYYFRQSSSSENDQVAEERLMEVVDCVVDSPTESSDEYHPCDDSLHSDFCDSSMYINSVM